MMLPSLAAEPGTSQAEDLRTLWVDYDDQGCRYKEWRKVCVECRDVRLTDSPAEGPPTVLQLMRHMGRHKGAIRGCGCRSG